MKSIVIFCRGLSSEALPFVQPRLNAAYQDLLHAIREGGAEAYFAAGNETYVGGGRFSRAITSDSIRAIEDYNEAFDVRAGLVIEKGGFTGHDVAVLNPPDVHRIASDKAETYRVFPELQPKTVICEDARAYTAAVRSMPGDLIVVKGARSNKGQAVEIAPAHELEPNIPAEFPVIVQEFMDTSIGIPGLVEGVHDLRVRVCGGNIIGGQVRTPAIGELRANVALGGSSRIITPDEVPAGIHELTAQIDAHFAGRPRYYAADYANTPNGWKLIELNSKPGFLPFSDGPEAERQTRLIAQYMIEICPET